MNHLPKAVASAMGVVCTSGLLKVNNLKQKASVFTRDSARRLVYFSGNQAVRLTRFMCCCAESILRCFCQPTSRLTHYHPIDKTNNVLRNHTLILAASLLVGSTDVGHAMDSQLGLSKRARNTHIPFTEDILAYAMEKWETFKVRTSARCSNLTSALCTANQFEVLLK